MGALERSLPSNKPFPPRRSRGARLPVYETLPNLDRERKSDDNYAYSDDDSDLSLDPSPSSHSSRNTSSSFDASPDANIAMMFPKRRVALAHRVRHFYPYRLPNRVVRYLCSALILSIVIMILCLARASQLENQRIAKGITNKASSPPPIWHSFQRLTRYYGGLRSLVPLSENDPEYPLPDGEMPVNQTNYAPRSALLESLEKDPPRSKAFTTDHASSIFRHSSNDIRECHLDAANSIKIPPIRYYDGRPSGFPAHILGSYELLSLPEDVCFDRYGRYGPYGYGYSVRRGGLGDGQTGDASGSELVWADTPKVDFRQVDWAEVQRRCYRTNSERFRPIPTRVPEPQGFYISEDGLGGSPLVRRSPDISPPEANVSTAPSGEALPEPASAEGTPDTESPKAKAVEPLPRSAVIVRCWDEYSWTADDILNMRALISEVSLASGGQYDVHILLQVKNDALHPVWADREIYEARIRDTVPAEFRGLVTIWTETQMLSLYQGIHDLFSRGPDLPVHGVYRGLTMALQYFASRHPEYDYFWQWEMDARYVGHYYDFLAKVEKWAKIQPRKGLWERNSRFYIPSVHGSWVDFQQMARVQSEMGAPSASNVWQGVPGLKNSERSDGSNSNTGRLVWGPVRPQDPEDWFETDTDPLPPTTYERDKYEWGVGEEADYITFNPIFDPEDTTWLLKDDITGYNRTNSKLPPRRANIITASRMSRRLVMTMHRETSFKKHFAFPEMWPATVALHHGYKAVYVPHPQFVEREWPSQFLAQTLNGGRDGASGGARTSVFGQREHNLHGLTWFYRSDFSPELYRGWLGLRTKHFAGGDVFELQGDNAMDNSAVDQLRGGEGRQCLPPMLLHPVKEVELPVEAPMLDLSPDAMSSELDPGS